MKQDRTPEQFETELTLPASPDVVWEALTDARELARWFCPEAAVQPGVGGAVTWTWPGLHDWPQTIEVWEPGTRLRTRYDSGVDDGAGGKKPLFIDFFLSGSEGSTTLRLVQSGFGEEAGFAEEYDGISKGWLVELRSLRLYLESHLGRDRQLAWAQAALDQDHATAWERLTGPEGLDCGARIDRLAEGEPFRIESPCGEVFEGVAMQCHEHQFCGKATSHGGAMLRLIVESCGGADEAWFWFAGYGRPREEIDRIRALGDGLLAKLFPAGASSAPAEAGA